MDIASTPEAAAPPVTIRREDYRPPDWLVPEVALDFALGVEETRVRAELKVRRNPDGGGAPAIRLNGDGIAALSVTVDGKAAGDWRMDGPDLLIDLPGETHTIVVETLVNPAANSQLMGLYASGGMLCTQCEAEGFRRIMFFPDRPDVLSTYRVRMEGDRAAFPVLLSNGNCTATGEHEDGSHWAEWHDPWPKPSYLFALVAGELVANHAVFTTCSGRNVLCNIWVRPGDEDRTSHALDSLLASMKWDEEVFGREYDLDLYNIVAVSDFNMGAMENKGLNVFNTRYVLADPDTATDADYDAIEGVIAHEYFHNWSGNRVTCRDWFQLSLKEGFTVLRDQLFSAGMGSEPVKRIEDVRVLRGAQFPEDSGPLAHPIRPDAYQEISNFYTSTVYNKGAEVIRMMRTLANFGAGTDRFRKGTDLYFERHDGEAATCEDFVTRHRGRRRARPGAVPAVVRPGRHAAGHGAAEHMRAKRPRCILSRRCRRHPASRSSSRCRSRCGSRCSTGKAASTMVNSWLRSIKLKPSSAFPDSPRARCCRSTAAFPRRWRSMPTPARRIWSSSRRTTTMPSPATRRCRGWSSSIWLRRAGRRHGGSGAARGPRGDRPGAGRRARRCRARRSDARRTDDPAGEELSRRTAARSPIPARSTAEREGLKAWLAGELHDQLIALHDRASAVPYGRVGRREGRAQGQDPGAGAILPPARPAKPRTCAAAQYRAADNMTDRQGALMVLCGLEAPERADMLAHFHERYAGNALVIDKWFSLQAGSLHPRALEHVKPLAGHPDFTLHNPNRVRALSCRLRRQPAGVPRGRAARATA